MAAKRQAPRIGTLTETSLHAALKQQYGRAGAQFETLVDGYVVDVVTADHLVEIQTGNFAGIKRKLAQLLAHHPIRLVYPIAQDTWIVRESAAGEPLGRRKSPKRGRLQDVFGELVYIPHLLGHPNLTLDVLLTQQEEVRRDDGQGSWRRRGWSIHDRRLLGVLATYSFGAPRDWLTLLPPALSEPFTNRELATAAAGRMRLAQKTTYTLTQCGLLAQVGKRGNAHLYRVTDV